VSFHTSKLYTEAAANCRDLTINEKVATQATDRASAWLTHGNLIFSLSGWHDLSGM